MRNVGSLTLVAPARGPRLLGPLVGGAAGSLVAAALATTASPLVALSAVGGAAAVVVLLGAPHLGLYAVTALTIAQWPGGIIKVAGIAVAVSALLWALVHRRRLVPRDALFLVLVLLSTFVITSAFVVKDLEWAKPPRVTATAAAYASNVAFYWMVSTLAVSALVVRRLATTMVVSGVVIAVIAFVQYRFPFVWVASEASYRLQNVPGTIISAREIGSSLSWGGQIRPDSLTGTPDYLGLTMQILLPFAVLMTWRQTERRWWLACAAAAIALAGAMILSLTRGVMISSVLIVVPLLAHRRGWRRSFPYLALGAVLLAAALVLWEPLRTRALSIFSEAGESPLSSGGFRATLLPYALQMFFDHFWLGIGTAMHDSLLPRYVPSDFRYPDVYGIQLPIHNSYLTTAIELGIFGISLVLAMLMLAWRRLRDLQRYFRATDQPVLLALAQAAEIAWLALAFNLSLYPGLEGNYRYIWVLLAFIGALSRVRADQRAAPVAAPARS